MLDRSNVIFFFTVGFFIFILTANIILSLDIFGDVNCQQIDENTTIILTEVKEQKKKQEKENEEIIEEKENEVAENNFPSGWMDCEKLIKFKEKSEYKNETGFYRQGYAFPIYNYEGHLIVIKGLKTKSFNTYKINKIKRSILAYLRITNYGKIKNAPGIPKFFGGCFEGPWWGMAMEFIEGSDVLCLDKKPFGDSSRCVHPNQVMNFMREKSTDSSGFMMNMTKSILRLHQFLIKKKAFLEDFTATNFVFNPSGEIFIIDFDSLMFQDNDIGFLSGTGCLEHNECPVSKAWTMTHGFADGTLGKCMERNGFCNNETRICQGFTANLMYCGFANWIFEKFSEELDCSHYRTMALCSSETDPRKRCSVEDSLALLERCSTNIMVPNVGYQPYRNYPRWNAMKNVIINNKIEPKLIIDFGSNSGFFSMKYATVFDSFAFAMDTNDFYKGLYPMSEHEKVSKKLSLLKFHRYCKGKWHRNMINDLYNTGKKVDVQVVLSIMHWLKIKTVEAANEFLKKMFLSATITFLELPKVRSRVMNKMKYWVGDRDSVDEIIGDVVSDMQTEGHFISYKFLTETIITDENFNSPRELFVIMTDLSSKQLLTTEELWKIYKCKELGPEPPPPSKES